MIGVLPMKKLNETSVTMDISGLETDAANAKSIIDAINAGEVADAPIDPEMPEELDFNTDMVPDEFSDDTIGVEDDVVPEMDEDDKLLLEDDPIEDSETIIADLIKDGATTTTDIDGAIRECCELIGESVDNIDFGKIHQLVEGLERQPDLFDDYYDVAYKNGRKLYTFGEIDQAMSKLLPNWVYSGDAYDGEELNLIYYPHSGVHFTQEDFDALKSGIKERFGNDVRVRFARSTYAPEQKKIYIGFLDAADEEKLDECSDMISEDTVKQGSSWVNKGKEGTHGKFKTKKDADAQRKAMFASGYKAESANEIPDFESLCEAAMKGEVVGKFYDGDNEADYKIIQRDGAFYIDSDTVLNRDGFDGPYASYAEAEHELLSTYPDLTQLPIEDGDLDVHFADAKETEFANDNGLFEAAMREGDYDKSYEEIYDLLINGNIREYKEELQKLGRFGVKEYREWARDMGIDESDLRLDLGIPESGDYNEEDEDFEYLFSLLTNGNIGLYRQKLQALGRDGVKKYIAWASDMGIPVTELKLYMGLNESANTYSEDDFVNEFERLETDALAYSRSNVFYKSVDEFMTKNGKADARITWSGDYYDVLGKEKAKELVSFVKSKLGVSEDSLNETSNPDCNYGVSPNPYLKDCKKTPCKMNRVKGFAARSKEQEGFPLRKDDGLSPKITAIKESADNMLASARSDSHKKAIIRRMADKMVAEGIAYSDAFEMLSDK